MQSWYRQMAAIWLGFATFGVCAPGLAQSDLVPAAKVVDVNWPDVARGAEALTPQLGALPKSLAAKLMPEIDRQLDRFVFGDKKALRPVALLNVIAAGVNPRITKVPIPVLAPIDISQYVSAFVRLRGVGPKDTSLFFSPAISRMQFLGKSTGYDIILTVKPALLRRSNVSADLVQIHLGGTGLLYEVDGEDKSDADAQRGDVVEDQVLKEMYPRIRRNVSDDGLTYSFIKYGVPYFANISCTNEPPFLNDAPCAEVEKILQTVLRDLRLIGGAPLPHPQATEGESRPMKKSPSFVYYAPGNLIPGTSQDLLGGVAQKILWGASNLTFPIKVARAHANSQNFMHGGDCRGHKTPLDHGRYECQQNPGKILEPREDNMENYAYPWRDNYCEERSDATRQPKDCPARSRAHEGQDIRPRECRYDGMRCKINLFDVVAVTKGSALWKPNNNVVLTADDNTGVYFVYLHMSPDSLKRAGLKKGQSVSRLPGQKIGEVGNWMHNDPNGTTAHLHFEIRSQKATCGRFGCTSAPYWTLIRSYERLIGMQGTEIP